MSSSTSLMMILGAGWTSETESGRRSIGQVEESSRERIKHLKALKVS